MNQKSSENYEIVKAHLTKKQGTIRLAVPKKIREALDIKAGDYLSVTYDKDNQIIFKKVSLQ